MKYKFRIVTGRPFTYTCYWCKRRLDSTAGHVRRDDKVILDRGRRWADLNGEAFKAYYCETCKLAVSGMVGSEGNE